MISPTNVLPVTPWYSLLPLVIVGVAVIGVVSLIMVGILIGRRVIINMKLGGGYCIDLGFRHLIEWFVVHDSFTYRNIL